MVRYPLALDRPELPLPQLYAFVVLADELHFGHALFSCGPGRVKGQRPQGGSAARRGAGKSKASGP
jgi:hypothetical protein